MPAKRKPSAKSQSTYFAILKRKADLKKRGVIKDGPTIQEANANFKRLMANKDSPVPHVRVVSSGNEHQLD